MKILSKAAAVLPALLSVILYTSCSDGTLSSRSDEYGEYFIGTNFWYGPILAGTGEGADRERLALELDSLKSIGLTNLRVLVGADGPDGIDVKVSPVLHTAPEVYDAGLEEGLAYFLAELEKRDMKAVLYLNNAWEWSGGYGAYMEWAGRGQTPNTRSEGYGAYMKHVSGFLTDSLAKELFYDHVRYIVGKYKDSKAIYSWQIANEPRCFSDDAAVRDAFVDFIWHSAALIKSIDPVHRVSTGSEGSWGCETSMDLYERLVSCPDVDYINIHIWPYNWSWVRRDSVVENLPRAIANTDKYIDEHLKLAARLGKKVVIEEFGYPRDGFSFLKGSPTEGRDGYYGHIFERVIQSARTGGNLLGVNFWGWGGLAAQTEGHVYWEKGDDYCNDPSQEEQGLNSVYLADSSTINLIRNANRTLSRQLSARVADPDSWLFTDGDGRAARRCLTLGLWAPCDAAVSTQWYFVSDTTLMGVRDTVATLSGSASVVPGTVSSVSVPVDLPPGFYQVCIHLESDVCGAFDLPAFNIGIDPEKIVSPQTKREDFDSFWTENLKSLAQVPLKAKYELMEERSCPERKVYRVQYKSLDGADCGGILALPTAPGKYPAYIEYMGYGADVYPYDGAQHPDRIQFLVSVRNQGIFRDCKSGESGRWIDRGLDSKDNFYYRGAFCDAVRAVDFVASLEQTDSTLIFGIGESQGGALTWVAASLDHRFRAIAPAVPFLSDYEDYGKIVWWPVHEVMDQARKDGLDEQEVYSMLTYFDVKNFTDRIQCPVRMAFGLQDPTCPPHTNFAGYNMVRTEKSYRCAPLVGHGMWEFRPWSEERDAWLSSFESGLKAEGGALEKLTKASSEGKYMYAHQDALCYGHSWKQEPGRSDVKDVCGDYPAIVGFDLGGIENLDSLNIDGTPFEYMREMASRHISQGGLVTFSWHMRNPLTGGDAWDVSSDKAVESVLSGGEKHDEFIQKLSRAADFLSSIEGGGKGIIFRPWHENLGSWFWWGGKLCSEEQYRQLWKLTYDYLAVERGLDMIWAYSPDAQIEKEEYMSRYPGDSMVDMLGVDAYHHGSAEDFIALVRKDLGYIREISLEKGKLYALTETGLEGIPDPQWWTGVLQKAIDGTGICYVLTWRNDSVRAEHFFGPWKGAQCEADFVKFYKNDKTLFLNDLSFANAKQPIGEAHRADKVPSPREGI